MHGHVPTLVFMPRDSRFLTPRYSYPPLVSKGSPSRHRQRTPQAHHPDPRKRSGSRRALGCDDRSEIREEGGLLLRDERVLAALLGLISSQITVHLPSPLNLAFYAPFLVSYTAHTSSDFVWRRSTRNGLPA